MNCHLNTSGDFDREAFVKWRYSPLVFLSFSSKLSDEVRRKINDEMNSFCAGYGFRLFNVEEFKSFNVFNSDNDEKNNIVFDELIKILKENSEKYLDENYEKNINDDEMFKKIKEMVYNNTDLKEMRLNWVDTMIYKIISFHTFSLYNLFDLPHYVLHMDLSETADVIGIMKDLKKVMPSWMSEFLSDTPISNVYVRTDQQAKVGSFNLYIDCIGDQKAILSNDVKDRMSREIKERIDRKIQIIEDDIKASKFSIKNVFSKTSRSERFTKTLSIPSSKMNYYHAASFYLNRSDRKRQDDRKSQEYFRIFSEKFKETYDVHSKIINMNALFISTQTLTYCRNEDWKRILEDTNKISSFHYTLYVFLLASEIMYSTNKESVNSIVILENLIMIIRQNHDLQNEAKHCLCGILFDKLFSMSNNIKMRLFYLSEAMLSYFEGKIYSHSLRCAIWLNNIIPEDSWTVIKKGIHMYKYMILNGVGTSCPDDGEFKHEIIRRGIEEIGDNLSFYNIEYVIPMICATINDMHKIGSVEHVMNSIRKIKFCDVVGMVFEDISQPEYWNLSSSEFSELISLHEQVCMKSSFSDKVLTYDHWSNKDKNTKLRLIPTNYPLKILIVLHNICMIEGSVRIDDFYASLVHVDDQGTEKVESIQLFSKNEETGLTESSVSIPPQKFSTVTLYITFAKPGKYSFNKLSMKYWGDICIETPCESSVIRVVEGQPFVEASVEGIPDLYFIDSCVKFDLIIKNISSVDINSLHILFNNSSSIFPCEYFVKTLDDDISCMTLPDINMQPGDSMVINFILRSSSVNISDIKMLVSASFSRVFYLQKSISVQKLVDIKGIKNLNNILQLYIEPTSPTKVIGFVNSQGNYCKALIPSISSFNPHTVYGIAIFPESITQDMMEYPLLQRFSKLHTLSIVYEDELGTKFITSINYQMRQEGSAFRIEVPTESSIKRGEVIKCHLTYRTKSKNSIVELIDVETHILGSNAKDFNIHSCRICGKKKFAFEGNELTTDIFISVFKTGFYCFPGLIVINETGDRTELKEKRYFYVYVSD